MLDSLEHIGDAECFGVIANKKPYITDRKVLRCFVGKTIADVIRDQSYPTEILPHLHVTISKGVNTSVVPLCMWEKTRVKHGAIVQITVKAQGPALGAILSAVLAAFAPTLAGAAGAALGLGAVGIKVLTAAISIIGALAINALIPPPTFNTPEKDDPNFSITGTSNAFSPFGVYPKVIGRHRMFPVMTAKGYTEVGGTTGFSTTLTGIEGAASDSAALSVQESEGAEKTKTTIYYRGRFTFGHCNGKVALDDLKIGTTSVTDFDGIELEFLNVDQALTEAAISGLSDMPTRWRYGFEKLVLYPDDIAEDSYSIKLEKDTPVSRETRDLTSTASVDVGFPGLVHLNGRGGKSAQRVQIKYEYRQLGDSTWIDAGTEEYAGRTTSQLRFTKDFKFPVAARYEIQVTRLTDESDNASTQNESLLVAVRSVRAGDLPSHENVAEVAVRIKASEQLNGRLDSLNAIVQQLVPVWDGTDWSAPVPNRHPAWQYADALLGPHLKKSIPENRVFLENLKDWADQEPHWTCDLVLDSPVTVGETLDMICAAGRAKRTMHNFKHSVIRDGGAGPIHGYLTPHNSYGFKATRVFTKPIHALRVRFISERKEWEQDELTVYADGYDATNATEIETLDFRGLVLNKNKFDQGNAYKLARYHLAQAILRPETYEFNYDLEHIRLEMGDKIRATHDVPLWGIGSGWISSIREVDGNLISLTLDDSYAIAPSEVQTQSQQDADAVYEDGAEFYLSFDEESASFNRNVSPPAEVNRRAKMEVRKQNGEGESFEITFPAGDARVFYPVGQLDAGIINKGDLVQIIEVEAQPVDLLIRSIVHSGDLQAVVTAVDAAPEVLQADQGVIPPYDPQITPALQLSLYGPALPVIVDVASDESTMISQRDGSVEPRINVTLSPTVGVDDAGLYHQMRWREYLSGDYWSLGEISPISSRTLATTSLAENVEYEVQVRSLNGVGASRGWTSAPNTIAQALSAPPATVENFSASVINGTVQLAWDPLEAPDIAYYELRYSSSIQGAWESSVALAKVAHPSTTHPTIGRSGRYFIKGFDFGGRSSLSASISEISADLNPYENAVETLELNPSWLGTNDGTVVSSGDLLLEKVSGDYAAQGTFTSTEVVDIGYIAPCTLYALIEAEGLNDNESMASWASLASVQSLSDGGVTDWRVDVEVRTTNDDPLSSPVWTDWKALNSGTFAARAFQFRMKLFSFSVDVTPLVSKAKFVVDIPDRVAGDKGVSATSAGITVTFSPPFVGDPAITVTPKSLVGGGRFEITNESRLGFDIEFFDETNTATAANFDWVARGYGRAQA